MIVTRRSFVALGTAALAATPSLALPKQTLSPALDPGPYAAALESVDGFVRQYLAELGAPGLTLVIADRTAIRHVASFGYADLGTRAPVTPAHQFHIGSISKSFVALALLQLVDEGRVSLEDPIAKYLPGLRFESPAAPITIHHLLTHTAALPDGPLFPSDPAFWHRPAGPLGRDFHYCNMGWQALGHLIEVLDSGSLADSLQRRILTPLGMRATAPVISFELAQQVVQSYWPARTDRPYPMHGSLVVAPRVMMTTGAGCVASTPADMGRYVQMLLNGGLYAGGRLVSESAFAAFSTPHIAALEFGPGTAYGYGIAVDTLDGHRRLRHTGGMTSFASALEVDLDSGLGVFVSVNAMQGVRPRPVAEFALRTCRASLERRALPQRPAPLAPRHVAHPDHYVGHFYAENGAQIEVVHDGIGLLLRTAPSAEHPEGRALPLEPASGAATVFVVRAEGIEHDWVVFPVVDSDAVVDSLGWGAAHYLRVGASRAPLPPVPSAWVAYPGHYRSEDPWSGSCHVILRAGRLWLDGVVPLEPVGDGRFWLRDEPTSPEWVGFDDLVGGRTMTMKLSGKPFERVTSG
jgi:hypothetical protein